MHRSLMTVVFSLVFIYPVIAPRTLQAQQYQISDVNVKNFPEIQHIRGDVQVSNFPEVQQVKGFVSVEGATRSIVKTGLVVHTSRRAELSEMISAGTIETEGYTSVLISLQGEMRSGSFSPGTIGVLLVPAEGPIIRVLRDAQRLQFGIECKAPVKGDSGYFESEQVQQRIGFSRYNVYLYNTSTKSAEANVYFYLSR